MAWSKRFQYFLQGQAHCLCSKRFPSLIYPPGIFKRNKLVICTKIHVKPQAEARLDANTSSPSTLLRHARTATRISRIQPINRELFNLLHIHVRTT